MTKTITLLTILILLAACGEKKETTPQSTIDSEKSVLPSQKTTPSPEGELKSVGANIDYHLNQPDVTMSLASKLVEISGLTYDQKNKELLAVNDEKGKIYHLDTNSGEIRRESKFGKKGDYEGIEIIDEQIYVLESSGQLSAVNETFEKNAVKIRTSLRSANDLEGLGYDAITKSLLLACKGTASIRAAQKLKKTKAIYSYSLQDSTLAEKPFITVKDLDLETFVINDTSNKSLADDQLKKLKKRIKSFSPSGIAQHPSKDHFYIISSSGKSLVVVDRNSKIVMVKFLDEAIHRQPEGICFDTTGDMYISNEGKLGIAKIYKFNIQRS